jgi:sigma-B regulation protein RsbU (phosphoserine phosphatase)
LNPNGAAVGLVEQSVFKTDRVQLQPGDVLVFYTDGISEASNADDEEFGEKRIVDVAKQSPALPAAETIRLLKEAVRTHTQNAPLADDRTILVVKVV